MRHAILTMAMMVPVFLVGCRGAPVFLLGVPAETPTTEAGTVDVPALMQQRCTWCHSAPGRHPCCSCT